LLSAPFQARGLRGVLRVRSRASRLFFDKRFGLLERFG
jgi:hypothetical protein